MAEEDINKNEENSNEAPETEQATPEVDELTATKNELAEMKDKYLRAVAEFDNAKKRMEMDKIEFAKFSEKQYIEKLLPIMDDFERAVSATPSDEKSQAWFAGFSGIHKKFENLLEMSNVTVIETAGKDFDPMVHEAIMQVPGEEGKVIAEYQKGYKLFDRVLRPARVSVGNGEPVPETK